MNNLTHTLARKYLDTQVDGVLSAAQKDLLDAHLARCASCQGYAHWLDNYEGWLKASLQAGAPARRPSGAQELYRVRRKMEEKVQHMKFLRLFNTAARWLAAAAMFVILPVLFVLLLQTRPSSMMGDLNGIPPGLLIVTGNHQAGMRSLWIQGQSGELDLLIESDYEADFELSPDRTQVLYTARGDIWLFDLVTRQSQNVTQTPDFVEWRPEWRPGGLVYVSTPNSQMGELTSATPPAALPHGLLTRLTFGGTPETLVPEPVAPLRIAPSPDGQAVAYITFNGITNDLWLYRAEMGVEQIDLSGYQGQPWAVDVSWSPDGQQQLLLALAGRAYQQVDSTHGAVALLDVKSGDFRTLFIYNPVIQINHIVERAAPAWSPDGTWLIFPVRSSDSAQSGLRVIERATMNESRHINFAGVHVFDHDALSNPERKSILPTPVISPDSQWAAMAVYDDVLLLRTADWQPIALGLKGNEQDFGILDVLGWGLLEPNPQLPSSTPTRDSTTLAPSINVTPEMPGPTETVPSPPTALPAPVFTGNRVSPEAIFAYSPIGGQWIIGVSIELWGIEPAGNTKLLARFTPYDAYYWPRVRLSPDGTMLAFGVETGGALYYPGTGEFLRFRGVDVAQDEPASIGYFAWSTDSQSLYYSVCCSQQDASQIWRIPINDPEKPQMLAEELSIQTPTGDHALYPAAVLSNGRLLMEYFPTEGSNAALWDMTTNRAIALTYQGEPIHVWDTQGMQAVFNTGPQTPLLVGRLGDRSEMLSVVEAQPPDAQPSFIWATFLPDGRIVAVWNAEATEQPQYDIVLLTPGDTGYSMTILTPAIPADAAPYYLIAAYGDRLIIDANDSSTGQNILSEVPLDGSPAIPLAEGPFQVVIP